MQKFYTYRPLHSSRNVIATNSRALKIAALSASCAPPGQILAMDY